MVLMIAAANFVNSCGPQAVGQLQRESQAVDLENAQCAHAKLRMGAGELNLTGGADRADGGGIHLQTSPTGSRRRTTA